MISIKSDNEIELMRHAGKVLAEVHERVGEFIKEGVTTAQIDDYAKKLIEKHHCTPSFLGLYDFPASACISVNEEVIHGIPSKKKIIKDGDLVSVDLGVCYKGYHSDAARTHVVGNAEKEKVDLVNRTRESFFKALEVCREGNHIVDIAKAITNYITPFGYGIVSDYVGHGVGANMHEDPEISNYYSPGMKQGVRMRAGMTIAIEPMINLGLPDVETSEIDGWTVTTVDKKVSSHYENTILITKGEPEIFSL